jgi:hypothetical protein
MFQLLFAVVKLDNPASVSLGIALIPRILRTLSRNHPENMSVHNKGLYTVSKENCSLTMSEMGRALEPNGRGSFKTRHKIIYNSDKRFIHAS